VQVDNNEGLDYKLKLVDAPTEEEVLDRRAREFEAAERDRLAQIAQAEAEISKEVAAQREEAEGDAMHEWWRVRRGELRQQAIEMVAQEMGGVGEGCADSMDVCFDLSLTESLLFYIYRVTKDFFVYILIATLSNNCVYCVVWKATVDVPHAYGK
jgi:hypothetical protein